MTTLTDLSASTLRKAADLKDQIESLQNELNGLLGTPSPGPGTTATHGARKKRHFSAASRAKMAAAQKARWARIKGPSTEPNQPKRTVSAAVRRARSKAAKARWAKARAAGKNRL